MNTSKYITNAHYNCASLMGPVESYEHGMSTQHADCGLEKWRKVRKGDHLGEVDQLQPHF
jgi:hypothetical protein